MNARPSMMKVASESGITRSEEDFKHNPADFAEFMPWACQEMLLDVCLDITKVKLAEPVLDAKQLRKTSKILRKSASNMSKRDVADHNDTFDTAALSICSDESKIIRIWASYSGEHLMQIKIDKTRHILREVLVILGLVIKFYPTLSRFSINSGADKYTIYEMCRFLPLSNISEINLDNTFIKEANYDMILESSTQLKVLSLSRCKLGDNVVEKIVSKLQICSMTLSVLNLSSNSITDKGAKFLGEMLRTNRTLNYLNLAGNMLSDEGLANILNSLNRFILTQDEILTYKRKYIKFLKDKQALIQVCKTKVRDDELERIKGKTIASANTRNNALLRITSESKAVKMAKMVCGEFHDPLGSDTVTIDNLIYSNGNNTLAYLNIAYNNISHHSVFLLKAVLQHQKTLMRTPRGLVNVCLEGNALPKSNELCEIDSLLDYALGKGKPLNEPARRKTLGQFEMSSVRNQK